MTWLTHPKQTTHPPTQVEILVSLLEAHPGKILMWGHQNIAPILCLSLESLRYEIGLYLSKVQTFLKDHGNFLNCRDLKMLDRRGKILCFQHICCWILIVISHLLFSGKIGPYVTDSPLCSIHHVKWTLCTLI